jgi:hypothetical protein
MLSLVSDLPKQIADRQRNKGSCLAVVLTLTVAIADWLPAWCDRVPLMPSRLTDARSVNAWLQVRNTISLLADFISPRRRRASSVSMNVL